MLVSYTSLLTAQAVYEMPTAKTRSGISSFENMNGLKANGGRDNKGAKGHAFERMQPGETKTLLNIKTQGSIRRIWMTVDQNPVKLRSLRLKMYWDGEAKAAVDVPMGDFFCQNLGKKIPFESALFSSGEGRSFICYIAMPFRKGAKVELINEGKEVVTLFYDIDFLEENVPAHALYFHAYWTRSFPSSPGPDFVPLPTVQGKGRFLGLSVGLVTDPSYSKSWWGEGEVKMFIDDDKDFPSYIGTGAEDYLGSAWGLGKFVNLYQGCTTANDSTGEFVYYRWHIPDPVYFYNNLQVAWQQIGGWDRDHVREILKTGAKLTPVTVDGPKGFEKFMEMSNPPDIHDESFPEGWVNFYRSDDLASVSYFYLNKPVTTLPSLPAVDVRTRGVK